MNLHDYDCFSRHTFVSDETHKNLTWLDHRIWRGSILQPDRSYDGHLSWTQVLAEHMGISGTIETLGTWSNPPRAVYCVGNNHYNDKDCELGYCMTVSLQRVRYRGLGNDRAVWSCKLRLGDEDVITILRTVGSGERFEFWGPSGYVSGLGLARERIIRRAHPHLPITKAPGHPTGSPDASKLSMSAVAKTYLERQPNASTPSTIGTSSATTFGTRASHLTPIVPVAQMQRQNLVIDLRDSSSDDEDEDVPASSGSSPLSSVATVEDIDLTIPDLAADSDNRACSENEPGATALVKRTLTSCPYCDFEGRASSHCTSNMISHAIWRLPRSFEQREKCRSPATFATSRFARPLHSLGINA
ncbi:hypothetical protein AC578_10075 [Pseudocercospora eumusae]|uniref:Uncharacterized protein n=1 Tax=Pseudocercospora eumusae TaxID=321146 RepID=A0A139H871_9PEZI|nr:hypothetical protein AC578_10075 [Pseudocercospora eumusae]